MACFLFSGFPHSTEVVATARTGTIAVYGAMRQAPPTSKPIQRSWFTRFARWTACHAGRPSTFLIATLVIVVWAVTGPIYHYSDTWQLVINTGTTIVTFLMVFLIQNTQN